MSFPRSFVDEARSVRSLWLSYVAAPEYARIDQFLGEGARSHLWSAST